MDRLRVLASFALVILLGACSQGGASGRVEMTSDQRFAPEEITVRPGEEIVFSNASDEGHTVTAYADDLPEGASYFASGGAKDEQDARDRLSGGLITSGESFTLTLDEPGTYTYFCIPHEQAGMKGTIVVEE